MPTVRSILAVARHHLSPIASGATAAVLLAVLVQGGASAAIPVTLSLDVAGMTYWADATQFGSPPCPLTPTAVLEREFRGTTGSVGTFISNLDLPQAARITSLRVVARDNDADNGLHAYIVRKRFAPSTTIDGFQAYKVLATVSTSTAGASVGITRAVTNSIANNVVDNGLYAYMAEIVNCADTVDSIGVQVVYSR